MAKITGLFYGMCTQSYKPRKASPEDLIEFHAEDYIKFLQNITPDNQVWTAFESLASLMYFFCAESLQTKISFMQMIVINELEVTNCTGRGPMSKAEAARN